MRMMYTMGLKFIHHLRWEWPFEAMELEVIANCKNKNSSIRYELVLFLYSRWAKLLYIGGPNSGRIGGTCNCDICNFVFLVLLLLY